MTLGEVLFEQCGYFKQEAKDYMKAGCYDAEIYQNDTSIIHFSRRYYECEWNVYTYIQGCDLPLGCNVELVKAIYTRLDELNKNIVHEEM